MFITWRRLANIKQNCNNLKNSLIFKKQETIVAVLTLIWRFVLFLFFEPESSIGIYVECVTIFVTIRPLAFSWSPVKIIRFWKKKELTVLVSSLRNSIFSSVWGRLAPEKYERVFLCNRNQIPLKHSRFFIMPAATNNSSHMTPFSIWPV